MADLLRVECAGVQKEDQHGDQKAASYSSIETASGAVEQHGIGLLEATCARFIACAIASIKVHTPAQQCQESWSSEKTGGTSPPCIYTRAVWQVAHKRHTCPLPLAALQYTKPRQ